VLPDGDDCRGARHDDDDHGRARPGQDLLPAGPVTDVPSSLLAHGHLRRIYPRRLTCPPNLTPVSSWNYTTWLNIAFLALAAALVLRFIRTGGIPMLRMMGGTLDSGHDAPGYEHDAAGHDHAHARQADTREQGPGEEKHR